MRWTAALLSLTVAGRLLANPLGGEVAAGGATIQQNGSQMVIHQHTDRAVINWQDFSIGANELTRFIQPGVDSAVLNRVLGGNPSQILGQLQANGSVYLINPNGVMVGPQGRVNVGAFFASTLDISDQSFLQGDDLLFKGFSQAGIQNFGSITAADGDVMLIAYTVKNQGVILAPEGVAGLAAGSEVLLTQKGDQRIVVKSGLSAQGLENGVENKGLVEAAQAELKAAGGSIYQLAVNQEGMISAKGVETRNGRVLLTAEGGNVKVSGSITAKNADGSGGEILVGGDFQGKNPAVANAALTQVTEGAVLDAGGGVNGDGGKVIVWADSATQFLGDIRAGGGLWGGDGGLVEVSGKSFLGFGGTVDTAAPYGLRGKLLLDPEAIIISDAPTEHMNVFFDFLRVPQQVPSYLNAGELSALLENNSVEVTTRDIQLGGPAGYHGITINSDITWSGDSQLTLKSGDFIHINANIVGGVDSYLDIKLGGNLPDQSLTGDLTLAADKKIQVTTMGVGASYLVPADGGFDFGPMSLLGQLIIDEVTIRLFEGTVAGDLLMNNADNRLGKVSIYDDRGPVKGDIKIRDSAGGLLLGAIGDAEGGIEIVTTGNLTLDEFSSISHSGSGDLVLAAINGSFINNYFDGGLALESSGSGRILIYSDTPANTVKNGITLDGKRYGKSFADNLPSSIAGDDDLFIYGVTPTATFVANDLSKVYGQGVPTLTYTISGLLDGDTFGDIATGAPDLSTTADGGSSVGDYGISITAGTLAATALGYQLAYDDGTLTVTKAPLTIRAEDKIRLYGGTDPEFTTVFDGLVNGDTRSVVSGLNVTPNAGLTTGIGTYDIVPGGANALNYDISYDNGTLTINRAPLTIGAQDQSKIYGSANPTAVPTYTGLVAGDSSSVVSGLIMTHEAGMNSGVGDYDITPSGALAANYSISYEVGTLTIDKAALIIKANDAARVFGEANPAFTPLFDGLVAGDGEGVVTGLQFSTPADVDSPVGNYAITPFGASAVNYDISYEAGNLAISAAVLTVKANDFSRLYGAVNPDFTSLITGFLPGDDESVVSGLRYNTAATVESGVGVYTITPFGASAANYAFNYQPGSLTINRADLIIRADDLIRLYGAANPSFTATYVGLVAGDVAGDIPGLVFGTPAVVNSPVSTYAITPSGAANPNYNISFETGTLTVNPAPLTITANGQTKVYGAALPTLNASISGLVAGDTDTIVSGLTVSTLATEDSNVGVYAITPSGATAPNYDITFIDGDLTVTKAPLTITANDATRLYGGADPSFNSSFSGLTAGDAVTDIIGLSYTTTAGANSGVGDYDIIPSGAVNANYEISYVNGSLTIDPASLVITAQDATRLYGATDPVFAATFAGLVAGDTEGDILGLILGTTAVENSSVGGYPVTPSGAANPNYAISFVDGTLTVTKAPLTIRPVDQSRTYGSDNASPVAGYTGLVAGDTDAVVTGLQMSHEAVAASSVGDYSIFASGATAMNYDISYEEGTLTVNPAVLTVRPDNVIRSYGSENPDFTSTITGFVLGQNESLVTGLSYSTAANELTGVGNYGITASGGSAPNYTIQYQGGNLRIDPAVVTVRADNKSRQYGAPDPELTYSVFGRKNNDADDSIFFIGAFGSLAAQDTPVGNYTIVLTGVEVSSNYRVFFQGGTMTVTRRDLNIRPDNVSRVYGDPNPTFTATYTGLASFDTPEDILGVQFSTLATINSGVSTWGIFASSGVNPNYNITYTPGQMQITQAPLYFNVTGGSKLYGRANPDFTFTYQHGLRNSDTVQSLGAQIDPAILTARDVGVYPVNLTLANPNYYVEFGGANLVIEPAPLTVTVFNQSRKYGENNPSDPTVTALGLAFGEQEGDIVEVVNPTTPQSNAGQYLFEVGLKSDNYFIDQVNGGLFTILPRHVILKPKNIARYYGDPNPEFEVLVGGEGLAPFHDTDDLVFSVDSDTNIGQYGPAGVRKLFLNTDFSPNYVIQKREGLMYILPRPVEIVVDDAVTIANSPLPFFDFEVSNLAAVDNKYDVFIAGLFFQVLDQDVAAPVGVVQTPDSVYIPTAYSDVLPITPINTPLPPPSTDGVITVPFTLVEIPLTPDTTSSSLILTLPTLTLTELNFDVPGFNTLKPEEKDYYAPVIRYIQPRGYSGSGNYVVTSVKNGKLTVHPDPVVAEQMKEADRKKQEALELKNARQNFNAGSTWGIPPEFNDQIQFALANAIHQELLSGNFSGTDGLMYQVLGEEWYSVKNSDEAIGKAIMRWLGDFHSNPAKQALLAPAMTSYISVLAKPGMTLTTNQKGLLNVVSSHVTKARDRVIDKAQVAMQEWQKGKEASSGTLATLYGTTVPYDSFVEKATGQLIEDTMTGLAIGAGLGSAAAGGGLAAGAVVGSFSAMFPYTALTASAVGAGAGGIAAAGIAILVVRAVQVGEEVKAQERYNNLVNNKGQAVNMEGFASNDANKAWMFMGIMEMLAGG